MFPVVLLLALSPSCSRTEPAREQESLPVAPPAALVKPAEPPKPSIDDATFRLALVGAPTYTAGAGTVELTLEARGGYHVNQDYPIRVDLKAPAGVKLAKATLVKTDAVHFGEERARFQLPFSAEQGTHELAATVDFAVCTKETCVPDQRTVALSLAVR